MQVVLVMFRNDGERRSFSVVRNMTIIGRREDCDLRIPVGDVSRKHCRLVRTDDGIRIEDLGSSNGTFVNGDRVQESDLHAGDTVGIGPVQFVVQIDGMPDDDELVAPAAVAGPIGEEDSMMGHPAPQVPQPMSILEEPTEEFQIEDEAAPEAVVDEITLEETPLAGLAEDSLAAAHVPITEELPGEEGHLPLELHATQSPLPLESPIEALAEDDLIEEAIPLDELTPDESALDEAAPDESALDESTVETIDEDAIPLEEAPIGGPAEEESPLEELTEEPTAMPAAVAPAPVGDAIPLEEPVEEFELLDELDEVEPEPAQPVVESLVPPVPAREEIEPVDLDAEELTPQQLKPTEAEADAGESDWDFVVEEADGHREGEDFKIDLDSPHEQPHGKS